MAPEHGAWRGVHVKSNNATRPIPSLWPSSQGMEGPPIEPSAFDVIVVGSGLVEDLIASSLILAGRSVLLIDQSDVYGSGFASFTMAGLQGSCDPALNPNISRPVPQQQQEQQHQKQQQEQQKQQQEQQEQQQQQQEQCKHAAPQ
ncbi:Rab proteins geranylgeranyltransferase component A 2, partial [Haematococcus lacustris]